MTDDLKKPEDVPYGNATDEQLEKFQDDINSTDPERIDGGWRWTVRCPRCTERVILTLRRTRYIETPEVPAVCECHHAGHHTRPEGVSTGCGFDVLVPMTPPDDA